MRENGFLNEDPLSATVGDILARRKQTTIFSASLKDSVLSVIESLTSRSISQVPVLDNGRIVGIVGERDLLSFLIEGGDASRPVEDIMKSDFAVVETVNKIGMLSQFFTKDLTVLVVDAGTLTGIITKIDYIDFISHRI